MLLLLDVVVGQCTPVFQLLSSKDQSLLIWRNTFLVLDLLLHVLDGIAWFYVKGDGFTGQSLYEDLHTTTQTKDQVQVLLPFGCYSRTMYARLPIAFQQRSIVADLEEYPPCLGSFASRFRWYRLVLRQG